MANKKVNNVQISEGNEISKLIRLVLIVTAIFLSFYLITFFVNKKEIVDNKIPAKIQYKEILIGNILDQPNNEYYVMINDKDDYNVVLYNSYLDLYSKKEKSLKYYTAELRNPLNKNFVSDTSNLNVTKITDLKINCSTLFKIKDRNIIAYYQGENLINHLKEISKDEA